MKEKERERGGGLRQDKCWAETGRRGAGAGRFEHAQFS